MAKLTVHKHSLKHFGLDAKPVIEEYLAKLDVDISDYTFAANYMRLSTSVFVSSP
jgi:hypothetical protein